MGFSYRKNTGANCIARRCERYRLGCLYRRQGAKGKDATIGKIAGKRVIKYRTTRTLNAREGMTILAKVDKGVIDPPSQAQISKWWWDDNLSMIIGIIALAIVSLYYFLSWWRIGRDLPEGVIVPRWDISDNMSPALVKLY